MKERAHNKGRGGKNQRDDTHLRNIDFFVSTSNGQTIDIGKKLLKRKEVIETCACIGEPSIDLRVKAILRTDLDILNMLECIKGTKGVSDAIWSEIIEVIGRKEDGKSILEPSLQD